MRELARRTAVDYGCSDLHDAHSYLQRKGRDRWPHTLHSTRSMTFSIGSAPRSERRSSDRWASRYVRSMTRRVKACRADRRDPRLCGLRGVHADRGGGGGDEARRRSPRDAVNSQRGIADGGAAALRPLHRGAEHTRTRPPDDDDDDVRSPGGEATVVTRACGRGRPDSMPVARLESRRAAAAWKACRRAPSARTPCRRR
jgi:hypothetical protein